ncbi:MAG: alkaline phosphatase family protein [Gemmatimonadaceae bacterium]
MSPSGQSPPFVAQQTPSAPAQRAPRAANAVGSVVVLVADGLRHEDLLRAIAARAVPALARMRYEGGLHRITTAFPSVTGVAYAPFLIGRHPGSVGIPGLRWYDRSRRIGRVRAHSRSYVGIEFREVDRDLDATQPTVFELARPSLGALSCIARGLPRSSRIGAGLAFAVRAGWTHFRGDVEGWLAIDRDVADRAVERIAREKPRYAFVALTGIDKTSHAAGCDAPAVLRALQTVDETARRIREDAERDGRWDDTHLWVVSDHGHSPVGAHDDIAALLRSLGWRVLAHPWTLGTPRRAAANVAVMVSGNAMAHLYLDLARREQAFWPALEPQWRALVDALLERRSIDLVLLPHGSGKVAIHSRARGRAIVESLGRWHSYRPETGDPLGIGDIAENGVTEEEAHEITYDTDYPDSLVQIARLAACSRAGDVMLSASRGWDFRGRYEPIPHVSSHGALHRDHMLVPLLLNRVCSNIPRRTVDLMPSALAALGIDTPADLEGTSFV